MKTIQIMLLVVGCCAVWCNGQTFSFTFGTQVGPETVTARSTARSTSKTTSRGTSRSFNRDTSFTARVAQTPVSKTSHPSSTNEIGKSPCPRGRNGFSCRQQLALEAQTCTGGQCGRCRSGCSNLSPTEWPTCCRDHFLCCRKVASACQQCNIPQLVPFCGATFERCS